MYTLISHTDVRSMNASGINNLWESLRKTAKRVVLNVPYVRRVGQGGGGLARVEAPACIIQGSP